MSDKKDLIVKKESIFEKISNFIKSIFKKNDTETVDNINASNIQSERNNDFENSIKVNKNVELSKIELIQLKFEKNEIELESLSNRELNMLNTLYQKQVFELENKLTQKLKELEKLKNLNLKSAQQ